MEPAKQSDGNAAFRDLAANMVKLTGALCVLAFFLGGPTTRAWMLGFLGGTISGMAGEPTRAGPTPSETPPLRLLGHGCRQEYGYQICEGEVRNVSSERLENVMVEVRFKDRTGSFIKSEDALISYQPLMPGQTSPFKVGTSANPMIWHYTIGFKQMFGGELKAAR